VIDVNELLSAIPDEEAITRYWSKICREMTEQTAAAEYERGMREGYLLAVADFKAFQHGIVKDAEAERRRWHLCCRRCRLEGHRDGCPDCQDRTRETFGQPFPGEPDSAELVARATASWEPFGLPPPGMVHVAGPVVHHHACTAACRAYKPGWYAPADAAAIIETLPGNYAEVLAGLRAQAGVTTPGKAAAA
jgi:hypothetical protein